jgi:TRAP-type C4-dicarboxylate transport system permease small subunit
MLTDALPAAGRQLAARIADTLMLLVCACVTWYSARLCVDTMGQSIAELPWLPVGVTYLAIPLGSLFTTLFVIERMAAGSQHERPVVRFGDSA